MAYMFDAYKSRDEHYPLEGLLEESVTKPLTLSFFFVGLVGTILNALVLGVFIIFYPNTRFTTRLWLNISVCTLLSSITCVARAIGDSWQLLSDSALDCRLRVHIPTALDIVCFGCLLVMCFDRLTVIHFPSLHIYNLNNNNCKIVYGWLFGIVFLSTEILISEHPNAPSRCVTPYSVAFPLETVSLFSIAGLLALLFVVILGYVFTPDMNTSMQLTWVNIEIRETVRVIWMTALTLILWTPKHFLGLVYLFYGYNDFEYQVLLCLMYLPARLVLLLPFFVLMSRDDFRAGMLNMVAFQRDRNQVKHAIAAEEANAEFVLHTVMLTVYPNHPALQADKQQSTVSSSPPRVGAHSTSTTPTVQNKESCTDHLHGAGRFRFDDSIVNRSSTSV